MSARWIVLVLALGLVVPFALQPAAAQSCACDPSPLVIIAVYFAGMFAGCAAAEHAEVNGQGDGCVFVEPFEDGVCAAFRSQGQACPLP